MTVKELESLEPKKLEWLLEIATNAQRLSDCLKPLKEAGYDVSLATFTRFVRKYKLSRFMAAGADFKESAMELTERSDSQVFRKGTLEAVRQRLFERAMESQSPDEIQKMYMELLKEEAKLRELELAARKVAIAEEEARWRRAQDRKRVKAEVIETAETRQIEESTGSNEQGRNVDVKEIAATELLARVNEALNRGGLPEEKVMSARSILNDGMKALAASN